MAYQFNQTKEEFEKVAEWLKGEYMAIHSGKASPVFLDSVQIESYGALMPIKNVASISIEDPKTLRVSPWDKSQVKDIEKAIGASNLGLSVATDESGLRVIFPMLTTENREKMVKVLKERLEEARIRVRSVREKTQKDIEEKEKNSEMSEDDKFRAKEELQKKVDEANTKLEDLFKVKENEILNN